MSEPLLQLKNVQKRFLSRNSGEINALQNINLDIYPGEFICIVGPSGCGKSTLLNMVAGLDYPSSGEILLENRPIFSPGPDRTVIFQEDALFPWKTVLGNILLALSLQGIKGTQAESIAMDYLKLVQLDRFKDSLVHELSGGMRARVEIARGLALHPKILLMDEPFAALDTQTRDLMVEELRGIWQRLKNTVLFITHHVREAVYLADKVVLMSFRPGKIKKVYDIYMQRPRDPDSQDFNKMISKIVDDLHREVEESLKEEMQS